VKLEQYRGGVAPRASGRAILSVVFPPATKPIDTQLNSNFAIEIGSPCWPCNSMPPDGNEVPAAAVKVFCIKSNPNP